MTFIIESFKITRLWDPVVRCKQNCVVSPACQRAAEAPSNMESLEPFVPVGLLFSRTAALKTGRFASHFLQYLLQAPPYLQLRQTVAQTARQLNSNYLVKFGGRGLPRGHRDRSHRFAKSSPTVCFIFVCWSLGLCKAV